MQVISIHYREMGGTELMEFGEEKNNIDNIR